MRLHNQITWNISNDKDAPQAIQIREMHMYTNKNELNKNENVDTQAVCIHLKKIEKKNMGHQFWTMSQNFAIYQDIEDQYVTKTSFVCTDLLEAN